MNRLKKLRFSLLPYEKITFLTPLTTEEVTQIIKGVSHKDLEQQARTLWGTQIPYKYKVYIKDEFVKIAGPFGNRISPVMTQGKIQLNPSNGKAILQLSIRPENFAIIQVILAFGIYFGVVFVILQTNDTLPLLIPLWCGFCYIAN